MDLIPLGTDTTNGTTSTIDSIPDRKKTPDLTPLTRPTELPEKNGKVHVLGDPDPDPSSSDSSSKKKKRDNKKNNCKHKKYDASNPLLISDSDLSYDSDYRRKRHNRKTYLGKGSDQIMRTFNGKVSDDSV